jgi:adenylate cyclase
MTAADQNTKLASTPNEQEIRSQLARIIGSADFDTSERAIGFLRFVVEETLAGRDAAISQNTIAQCVFGRGDEFDPAIDPIVRMQAGRVRRSLEHYYLTAGHDDAVAITITKGSYVPTFAYLSAPPPATVPATALDATPPAGETWPMLFVSPLRNLTGRPDVDFIAQGLASDLAVELNRYAAISVFLAPGTGAESTGANLPRFELTGSVILRGEGLRITFHLVDKETGEQRWAQTFPCPDGVGRGAALDQIVQTTAATVAEEHGVLASHLTKGTSQRPATDGNAYEAILRYHHFELTHEPQAFVQAFAALRQAVTANPDCAICWSYLARLGGTHWSLGTAGEVIPIEDSIAAARRGAGLAPNDVLSRLVLSYVLLLGDEVDEARAEANAALERSGMSNFLLDGIGYLLSLSGDWERGPDLIRRALRVNPFPRRACYCALWLDALRRRDADDALDAARKSSPIAYFWSPLMQAVALVEAGRVEAAAPHIEQLLQIKPDFPQRAEWLIRRYVKFDDLVCRIEHALERTGLALDADDERPAPPVGARQPAGSSSRRPSRPLT